MAFFSGEAFLERPKGSKRLKGTWLKGRRRVRVEGEPYP